MNNVKQSSIVLLKPPLHPWVWPYAPWKRVHVDLDHMFLLVVDAHSKWPEVMIMSSTTSPKVIETLRSMFSHYGLPEQAVSDNGPQFTSLEFAQFMRNNGIKHIKCAPYHPASNGLVERFVQTMKRPLKAEERDGKTIHHRLAEFLLAYRSTEQATTKLCPSQLFLGWKLRTRFDLLKPDTKGVVLTIQADQKQYHDRHVRHCLCPGTPVMVQNFQDARKWIPGTIVKKLGPVTYSVDLGTGRLVRKDIDHLMQHPEPSEMTMSLPSPEADTTIADNFQYPEELSTPPDQPVIPDQARQPLRRYPQRERHPPDRYSAT